MAPVVAAVRSMASEASSKEPEPGPQMLAPDADHDLAGRIVDLELVGAPRDRACVPEQLVFQAIPRFLGGRSLPPAPAF